MSMHCAHAERTEDLALGILDDEAGSKAAAISHLESCERCREAHAMFLDERALFAAHREAHKGVDAATFVPFLDLDKVDAEAPASEIDGRSRFARTIPAMLAAAAGIFALVTTPSSPGALSEIHRAAAADEPLACSFPSTSSAASRTLKEDLGMSTTASSMKHATAVMNVNMTEDPTNACMNVVTSSVGEP